MTVPPPLIWTDSLATHVDEIDEQHQILVNALNEARGKFQGAVSRETVERILQDLLSYAIYHFETEESLMQARGYALAEPAMAALHLEQHRGFSATVSGLREHFQQTGELDKSATLAFLDDWLVQHIMSTDQHLGRYLNGAPPV